MSGTLVRSVISFILENGLQMNDVIEFKLSSGTREVLGTKYDVEFVGTEVHYRMPTNEKTVAFVFDLEDVTDREEDDE